MLPEADVCNYFVWRQNDTVRNSIAGFAQSIASHKELHGLNSEAQKALCLQRGLDWDEQEGWMKRGWCVNKGPFIDRNIPRFSENRVYVERYLATEPEG